MTVVAVRRVAYWRAFQLNVNAAPPSGAAPALAVPPCRFENAPGDGQAETIAAGRTVAGAVEPGEGGENVLAFLGRDADTVVIDVEQDTIVASSALTMIRLAAYLKALRNRLRRA